MKWLKRIGIVLLVLIILAFIGLQIFMYKAKHGFATYETTPHEITIDEDRPAILILSKTTGFRHGAAIEAAVPALEQIAKRNNWFVYNTEDAGIFNKAQLEKFDVVIWNNSTGPVLNDEQRALFQSYVESGGGYMGIHGAGDSSHDWDWYLEELISANFSHHPIKNHIQKATVFMAEGVDSSWQSAPLWTHEDEWYIFDESPTEKGAQLLYTIDGTKIDPNGNFLWMTGKDFGMGKTHPVAWTKEVKSGRAFYTSMGHSSEVFENKNFLGMLTAGIKWSGKL